MFEFLYGLPDVYLMIVLNAVFIGTSIIAVFLVRRFIPFDTRYRENSVIGNISSVISIIYGVLAGLMALYLMNNIGTASDAVLKESNALANLYRDSLWLSKPTRGDIDKKIIEYINTVANDEWPLMAKGQRVGEFGSQLIDDITHDLILYNARNNSENLLIHDMLDEIKTLYNARKERIQMSYVELNPDIWVVIVIGTLLIIVVNYLFGMHFYLHIVSMVAISIMASSMIFLLITLDKPFQGSFVIDTSQYLEVRDRIEKNMQPQTQNKGAKSGKAIT